MGEAEKGGGGGGQKDKGKRKGKGRGRSEKEKEKTGRFIDNHTVPEAYRRSTPTKRLRGGCGVWRLAIKSKFKVLCSMIPVSYRIQCSLKAIKTLNFRVHRNE